MSAPHLGGHFTPAARQTAPTALSAESKGDQVRNHAEAHYQRHAKAWVSERYTKLLLREAPQPSLRPDGAVDDRKSHLMRAAIHLVQRKQHLRLTRIEMAAQRMAGRGNDAGIGR